MVPPGGIHPVISDRVANHISLKIDVTPTLEHFVNCLRSHGRGDLDWQFMSEESPRLILKAAHEAVGPLTIYDDTFELTLEFGRCYHCHFDGSESELPPNATEQDHLDAAAALAAEYVARILDLRIGVAVHYQGDHCTGASLIDLDDAGMTASKFAASASGFVGGKVRSERFLWTGPIPDPGILDGE